MSGSVGSFAIGVSPIGVISAPFDSTCDYLALIDMLAPGVVVQRESLQAVSDAFEANGGQPLTQAQLLTVDYVR